MSPAAPLFTLTLGTQMPKAQQDYYYSYARQNFVNFADEDDPARIDLLLQVFALRAPGPIVAVCAWISSASLTLGLGRRVESFPPELSGTGIACSVHASLSAGSEEHA